MLPWWQFMIRPVLKQTFCCPPPDLPVSSVTQEQTDGSRLIAAMYKLAQGFNKQTFYVGDASHAASCRTMDLATRPAPSRVAHAGPHQEP